MTNPQSDLDRIVEEITTLVRKSEFGRLREYVQNLVLIGIVDTTLSTKILDEE